MPLCIIYPTMTASNANSNNYTITRNIVHLPLTCVYSFITPTLVENRCAILLKCLSCDNSGNGLTILVEKRCAFFSQCLSSGSSGHGSSVSLSVIGCVKMLTRDRTMERERRGSSPLVE